MFFCLSQINDDREYAAKVESVVVIAAGPSLRFSL